MRHSASAFNMLRNCREGCSLVKIWASANRPVDRR
jgi:hypothetical protein